MKDPKIKLLLIEENQTEAAHILALLTEGNERLPAPAEFDLTHVRNPEEARGILTRRGFDLILLSIKEVESSLEELKHIRLDAPAAPVILLNGHSTEALALRALQLGAADFLARDRLDSYNLFHAIFHAIERGRILSKMNESEAQYRDLVENIHDLICTHDLNGIILSVNRAVIDLLGYAPEELTGRDMREILPPDAQELFEPYLRTLRTTGKAEGILKIRAKSGETRLLEYRNTLRTEDVASPIVRGYARDVTEQKEAEEALRASEEQYRSIIEDISELIIRFLPDGTLTYVNDAYCRYFGKSREELIGSNFISAAADDFPQKLREHFDSFAPDRPSFTFEQYDPLPNGEKRWREWMDRAIFSEDGRLIEFQSTGRDITERKRAEDALRKSEARYRQLFEANPHPMWVYDLETLRFLAVNDAAVGHYGYSRDEFLSLTIADIRPPEDLPRLRQNVASVTVGVDEAGLWRHIRKDGGVISVEITSHTLDFDGRKAEIVLAHDITERKQTEAEIQRRNEDLSLLNAVNQALNRGESLAGIVTLISDGLKRIFNGHGATIYLLDADHQRLVNQNMALPPDLLEKIEKLLGIAIPRVELDLRRNHPFRRIFETKRIQILNEPRGVREHYVAFADTVPLHAAVRAAAKKIMPIIQKLVDVNCEMLVPLVSNGEVIGVMDVGNSTPFTEEDARRMESIAAQLTAAIQRKQAEEALRASEERFRTLVNSMNDVVYTLDRDRRHTGVFGSWVEKTGLTPEYFLGKTAREVLGEQAAPVHEAANRRALDGEDVVYEWSAPGPDGTLYYQTALSPLRDSNGAISGIVGIGRDITALKRAEESLRRAEEKYRNIFESAVEAITQTTPGGKFITANPAAARILGYDSPEALISDPGVLAHRFYVQPGRREEFKRLMEEHGSVSGFESEVYRRDGSTIWISENSRAVRDAAGNLLYYEGAAQDITERRQAEEKLAASESELRALFAAMSDIVIVFDGNGRYLKIAPTRTDLLIKPPTDLLGKTLHEALPREKADASLAQIRKVIETRQTVDFEYSLPIEGKETWFSTSISPLNGKTVTWVAHDITARRQAQEKIRQQVQRLTALREIDLAIVSSFDMSVSLTALLSRTVKLLGADAADVLLANVSLNTLEYAAGLGFRLGAPKTRSIKLTGSYAGQAALERRIVQISNVGNEQSNLFPTGFLKDENFLSYYGAPLIAKGKVVGVLEVFSRSAIQRDREWLDFLTALAGQAAIAVDNAQLFNDLQRSNAGLIHAYNKTIEGWSKALDLRDKETEGHTQRVTSMTVELARALGINEAEIIHIQRGGLLHDIGKMGIPDRILLKPGQLTDEEWEIMRRHPVHAYEMLSPISYLKPALDIPYCHHEKWDGTGYPQGLKGEQIPLAARIFAVVDVWDALTSDRPYRPGWSKEKALQYIKEQSGKHFDPEVVEAFLRLIEHPAV